MKKECWDEIIVIHSQGFWIGIKLLQIYRDELWTLITQSHKAWVGFAGNTAAFISPTFKHIQKGKKSFEDIMCKMPI